MKKILIILFIFLFILCGGYAGFISYKYFNLHTDSPSVSELYNKIIDRSITKITKEDLSGVIKIGESFFAGCRNLTSVELPNSVTEVGRFAFNYCDRLHQLILSDNLQSIGQNAFSTGYYGTYEKHDGGYYLKNNSGKYVYLYEPMDSYNISSFTISEDCKFIESFAFSHSLNLTKIIIPFNVQFIGSQAFSSYTLTDVTIDSHYIYVACTDDDWGTCGGLIEHATTVKVLKSIVDDKCNPNDYLNNPSNYTKTTSGNYYVFLRV